MKPTIAVLGGGNGAHAIVADLTFAGYEVTLFEFPQFKSNVQKVLETREIIKEGVPYGMVLTSSLGDMLHIPTPVHDSVIELCSKINGENYWETGRTVEKLGIKGLEVNKLKKFLTEGEI
jgi:opine dehydrogenase